MMINLILATSIVLGYLAVGTLLTWVEARTGFIDKDDPVGMSVVFWPLIVIVHIGYYLGINGERLILRLIQGAFTAHEQDENKEHQLRLLKQQREKELQSAIEILDKELALTEKKTQEHRFKSPAVSLRVDAAEIQEIR